MSSTCFKAWVHKDGTKDWGMLVCRVLKGTKYYYFYSPQDNKIFVNANVTFLEKEFIRNHKPRSKIILEELSKPSELSINSKNVTTKSDSKFESNTQLEHHTVVP